MIGKLSSKDRLWDGLAVLLTVVWFSMAPVALRHDYNGLAHAWMPVFEGGIIFWLNYMWLIDRLLFRNRKPVLFVATNLGIILFFRFDMQLLHLFIGEGHRHAKEFNEVGHSGRDGRYLTRPFSLVKSLFTLALPALLALAVKGLQRARSLELSLKEAENQRLQAELASLKEQLRPHFLFNSLNNIYSLIAVAPEQARSVTHALSKLLRYVLDGTSAASVDLHAELDFIARYLDLMGIRQPPNLTLQVQLPEVPVGRYRIAPLLLIPLVENAFKHGVSATLPSRISIHAAISKDHLEMDVTNTLHPRSEPPPEGTGLGLENLRNRLQLLYPQRYRLQVDDMDGLFKVSLSVELEKVTA